MTQTAYSPIAHTRTVFQCGGPGPSPRLATPTIELPQAPTRPDSAKSLPAIAPKAESQRPSTPSVLQPSADDASSDSDSSSMSDPFGLGELVASARAVVADCERTRRKSVSLQEQAAGCVHKLVAMQTRTVLPPIASPTQSPVALPAVQPQKRRKRFRRRSEAEIAKLAAFKQQREDSRPAKLVRKCSFHASRLVSKMVIYREKIYYTGLTPTTVVRRPSKVVSGALAWHTWTRAAGKLKELVARWRVHVYESPNLEVVERNNAGHATRLQKQIDESRELEEKRRRAHLLVIDTTNSSMMHVSCVC